MDPNIKMIIKTITYQGALVLGIYGFLEFIFMVFPMPDLGLNRSKHISDQ